MAAIGKFSQEMARSGVLLMTGGLQRPTKGTRIKLAGGKFTATDGPFAETKELIDGFALVQVKSREEAIEVARRFMIDRRRRGRGDPPGLRCRGRRRASAESASSCLQALRSRGTCCDRGP